MLAALGGSGERWQTLFLLCPHINMRWRNPLLQQGAGVGVGGGLTCRSFTSFGWSLELENSSSRAASGSSHHPASLGERLRPPAHITPPCLVKKPASGAWQGLGGEGVTPLRTLSCS